MTPVPDGDSKTPIEQAVEHAFDVFVYAPIGLLFEGASLLPELIAKGKSHVAAARVVGKYTVSKGSGKATRTASRLQDQAAGVLDFLGDSVTPLPSDPPARRPSAATAPARRAPKPKAPAAPTPSKSSVEAASLAIPDYDGLSASQVVNRLAGLSQAELRHVQLYEAAHRSRKTILSKVAQLKDR